MRRRWRFRGWRLYWEPRDIWVGVYWNVSRGPFGCYEARRPVVYSQRFDVWVCLIPCVPLHLRWYRTPEGSGC